MASFDENGKYIKTNWKAGDKITATKLNKIEESIEAVNDNDISRHVEADTRLDALEAKDIAHDKELTNIKKTIADNKAAAELGDYDINSRMTFLENELNEGIEEVHNVAETVDGKINAAEANMTSAINTAKSEMTTQVNQGKADMEAMVAEVEADLEGLHAKDEELSEQVEHIKKSYVCIEDFGGGVEKEDNHNAIMECIENISDGGIIRFGNGVYKTSPLDLTDIKKSICFEGCLSNANLYQTNLYNNDFIGTTIRFINVDDYGIYTAKQTNSETTTILSKGFKLKNIILDGNNVVNTVVNGNYNLIIENSVITKALENGVIIEDCGYPVFIKDSTICFNGDNGIFIKGPRTTVLNIQNSDLYWNKGYGCYAEGYAHFKIKDCCFQSNKRGGLKVRRENDKYSYSPAYYTDKLLLDGVYFEANGVLTTSDENYEGNFNIHISSDDEVSGNATKMVRGVKIRNCYINPSHEGKNIRIGGVYGFDADKLELTLNMFVVENVNYAVMTGINITKSDSYADLGGNIHSSYVKHNYAKGVVYNHGLFYKRGHNHKYYFNGNYDIIPYDSSSSKTVVLKPALAVSDAQKGVIVSSPGSLLSVEIRKMSTAVPTSGTVDAYIYHYSQSNTLQTEGTPVTLAVLNLDFKEGITYKKELFDVDTIRFDGKGVIGCVLRFSSDYTNANNWTNSYQVVVEIED